MNEQLGDIVITCFGGSPLAPGSTIPTANITVSVGTNVTSRLIPTGSNPANTSEALLLIDEPNTDKTGTYGVGPTADFTVCSNPGLGAAAGGCAQVVSTATAGGTAANPAAGQSSSGCSTSVGVTTCTAAANVFQGLVSANQITFFGVPVNHPVYGGIARVFRVTNVRANVSALGGGGLAGSIQMLATISVTGPTSLPIANPVQIAGFIQSGLTTSLRNPANTGGGGNSALPQCGGGGPTALSILRFSENFATAFKTRIAPASNTPGSGQLASAVQAVPGTIYNSESGLTVAGIVSGANMAGLADYGTRLKAVFQNVPAGVRIFVSTTNVINSFVAPPSQPAANSTSPYAVLLANETDSDGNGTVPARAASGTVNDGATPIAELQVVNGTATAVWEVINTNPASLERFSCSGSPTLSTACTFDFGVWQQFTPNVDANSPPPGTATVSMSYAPTPPGAFSASAGATASDTLPLPRFADTSAALNIFAIQSCTPALTISKTHVGNFSQGQSGATYTVTVSNQAAASPTNGTVTVTETVPIGLTLVSMAGTGWTCPAGGTTCTRSDPLLGGSSYPPITVTVSVGVNATSPQVNQVSVSGGGSIAAGAADSTTIAGQTQVAPAAVSITPGSGAGATQTFTGIYEDANGFLDLRWVQMLFAVASDGGGEAYCFVHYDVPGNSFWLYGEGGFFVGPVAPGTVSNRLQNSICALNTSGSSVVGSGTTLTINANLVFKQGVARNIYMRAQDLAGADTGWVQRGTWNLSAAPVGTMSVSPTSGSGSSQTFTLTYPDPPGFAGAAFGWTQFLVANASDGGGQPFCFVHYDRAGNGLWMYSSDVGFFLGPVVPGTASNALNSSACSVNTGSATVNNTGGNLVVNVPITMKAPMSGAKKLFERTLDVLNRDTGWQQSGTWNIP